MTRRSRSASDLGSRTFSLVVVGVVAVSALACSSGGTATGGSGGAVNGSGGSGGGSGGAATPGGSGGATTSGGSGGAATGGRGDTASGGSGGAMVGSGSGGAAPPASGGVMGTAGTGMTGTSTGGMGGARGPGGGSGAGGAAGSLGNGGNGGGTSGSGWNSVLPAFTKHTIAASFPSGYSGVIADIDHDGMPDVVALSSVSGGLVWFKNPSWTKYTITTKPKQLIFLAPYDVDGDGDLDMAFISDFAMTDTMAGGTISWAENPGTPTTSQDWAVHAIDAIPTSHRLRWADLDGDGKKELVAQPLFGTGSVAPAYMGAVKLTAFSIPADPKTGKWTSKVIDDTHLEVAHELQVVKLAGDKGESLITSANDGVDIYRSATGTPTRIHVGDGAAGQAPNKGASEAVLGTLAGQQFIATIEPFHGTDAVVYMLDSSYQGTRKVLGSDFEHGHGMAAADFNGDGYDEFVGGGGQGAMVQNIYRYVPSTKAWDKIELDKGSVAVSYIDTGDINGDGAPDIVTIGTGNVVWYENMRVKAQP